jgi:hypothetical protein
VRGRLGGHPGFVEDLFTMRFNEMMGITSGGRNEVRTLREQMCRCRDKSLEAIEKRGAKMDPGRGNCSWGTQEAKMGVVLCTG